MYNKFFVSSDQFRPDVQQRQSGCSAACTPPASFGSNSTKQSRKSIKMPPFPHRSGDFRAFHAGGVVLPQKQGTFCLTIAQPCQPATHTAVQTSQREYASCTPLLFCFSTYSLQKSGFFQSRPWDQTRFPLRE